MIMNKKNNFLNRNSSIFYDDLEEIKDDLNHLIKGSRILVIGAAGTIGQSVFYELFSRKPKSIQAVDISENNLVELVRTIRSSPLDQSPELKTYAIDYGSNEFKFFIESTDNFDYVFNLSALKHVRSEKDEFTLMRLIRVNIFNTVEMLKLFSPKQLKKYFVVSTDKATNPVNMMGASKRIMEQFLFRESEKFNISMARFANVAFSDGSLLHGFNQRILKKQPLSAPNDVERYFITQKESGELCMISGLMGENRDIFFPKLSEELSLTKFSDIAVDYLATLGFEPYECQSEEEAVNMAETLIKKNKWPCYFFKSDTTGEKDFEEFFTEESKLDQTKFKSIGIIKNDLKNHSENIDNFYLKINKLLDEGRWERKDLIDIFKKTLPDFSHKEKGRNLDEKM
tara:strand:- start:1330 stop:2526 length:1197 start_codon:yes stop_codon:yes gene_type:complete